MKIDKEIKFVQYSGENRCVKCCFVYDNKECMKHKCTKEENNGKQGYYLNIVSKSTYHINLNNINV